MTYSWDDHLKDADLQIWCKCCCGAALCDDNKLPRALISQDKPVRETSFHVFCNSTQDICGARAYLRRGFEETAVESWLIAAKGQVGP